MAQQASKNRLYTPEERERRDATRWTLVQGILAPLQFLAFGISLFLVLRYLATGEGYAIATASVLIKTGFLYVIMVTGAIWEKVVFGQYLLAPAFFWEDVFSFVVIALHTAYLVALFTGASTDTQMYLALAAYATYVVNAAQFILKLRAARLDAAKLRKPTWQALLPPMTSWTAKWPSCWRGGPTSSSCSLWGLARPRSSKSTCPARQSV